MQNLKSGENMFTVLVVLVLGVLIYLSNKRIKEIERVRARKWYYTLGGCVMTDVSLQELWDEYNGSWLGYVDENGKRYAVGREKYMNSCFEGVPPEKQEVLKTERVYCSFHDKYVTAYFYRINKDY